MTSSQLDHLDAIANRVIAGDLSGFGVLSTGERLYVALAANAPDLLAEDDYTIAQALRRLDDGDVDALMQRWAYVSVANIKARRAGSA
jgi:hypothetical protein